MRRSAPLFNETYFSIGGDFICYLLTAAVMPTTKTLLLKIFVNKYSVFGPAPRTPSCMQRSYLLSIDFKVHSITDWAAQLKINPLYAIFSGFDFGDTPGVGTFYAFFRKLLDSDSDNLSPHIRPLKKKKVKQPAQKGSKARSIEKVTVEQLLKSMENTSFPSMTSLTHPSLRFTVMSF